MKNHTFNIWIKEGHFKEDCTILFNKDKTVEKFFGRFRFWKHLFVAYFASKFKLLDNDEFDFYHKDLLISKAELSYLLI